MRAFEIDAEWDPQDYIDMLVDPREAYDYVVSENLLDEFMEWYTERFEQTASPEEPKEHH